MARRVCRGHVLFIDDVVTYEAGTPDQLQKEFEAAVDDYLETCTQVGKQPQRPFKGLFNVRVPPTLHRAAAVRATADGVALNEVVVQALTVYLHIRPEVNHLVKVTFEGTPSAVKTFRAVTSNDLQWVQSHVH